MAASMSDEPKEPDANDLLRAGQPVPLEGEPIVVSLDEERKKPRRRKGGEGAPPSPPITPNVSVFSTTDTGNAERFARALSGKARFVPMWKKWIVWDGVRWVVDWAGNLALGLTRVVLEQLLTEARDAASYDARRFQELLRFAARSAGKTARASMLALAAAEPGMAIDHALLDRDPWVLNVANGTLDLRRGELRPHSSADLLTKITTVDYDPNAEAPLWRTFIDQITKSDVEVAGYLQRFAGYCLTGSVQEQCFLFAQGTGANGKGTYAETLRFILGDYAGVARAELLMEQRKSEHQTEVASLFGKRLVLTSETKREAEWDEPRLKWFTGGDTLTARRMNEDEWTFEPTHKFLVLGNSRPNVQGRDDGIWRRIHLVPFEASFPEGVRDPELPQKLRAEASGILRWAVEGCLEWLSNGGLRRPRKIEEATLRYRRETDALAEFLRHCCVVGPDHRATRKGVRQRYEAWCQEQNDRPWRPATLTKALRERGFVECSVKDAQGVPQDGWKGLRVLHAWERSPAPEGAAERGVAGGEEGSERRDCRDFVGTSGTEVPTARTLENVGNSSLGREVGTSSRARDRSKNYNRLQQVPTGPYRAPLPTAQPPETTEVSSVGTSVGTSRELSHEAIDALPAWAKPPQTTERAGWVWWYQRLLEHQRLSPTRPLDSCGKQARDELIRLGLDRGEQAVLDDLDDDGGHL